MVPANRDPTLGVRLCARVQLLEELYLSGVIDGVTRDADDECEAFGLREPAADRGRPRYQRQASPDAAAVDRPPRRSLSTSACLCPRAETSLHPRARTVPARSRTAARAPSAHSRRDEARSRRCCGVRGPAARTRAAVETSVNAAFRSGPCHASPPYPSSSTRAPGLVVASIDVVVLVVLMEPPCKGGHRSEEAVRRSWKILRSPFAALRKPRGDTPAARWKVRTKFERSPKPTSRATSVTARPSSASRRAA